MAQSSSPIAPEVEAKLIIPHARGVRAIARLKRLGGHPLRPRGLAHLHSLYLDTPELILARHGVALSLLRACGAELRRLRITTARLAGAASPEPPPPRRALR